MNKLILNIDGVITTKNIPTYKTHIQLKTEDIDKHLYIPFEIYLFLKDIEDIKNTEIYYLSKYEEKANSINRLLNIKDFNILKDIKDLKADKKDNIIIVDNELREETIMLLSLRENTAIILTENNAGLSKVNIECIKGVLKRSDLGKSSMEAGIIASLG